MVLEKALLTGAAPIRKYGNVPFIARGPNRSEATPLGQGDDRRDIRSGQSAQRSSEQNDDGFSTEAKEGKLQISGVFDLAAKLAKLICHRVVINPESLLVILPV